MRSNVDEIGINQLPWSSGSMCDDPGGKFSELCTLDVGPRFRSVFFDTIQQKQ